MTGLVLAAPAVTTGLVFPEAVVQSEPFAVLAAFVAINTVMYVVLAVAKILPKVYPSQWFGGRDRRVQNRSISPELQEDGR